jgi:hypothetical protein
MLSRWEGALILKCVCATYWALAQILLRKTQTSSTSAVSGADWKGAVDSHRFTYTFDTEERTPIWLVCTLQIQECTVQCTIEFAMPSWDCIPRQYCACEICRWFYSVTLYRMNNTTFVPISVMSGQCLPGCVYPYEELANYHTSSSTPDTRPSAFDSRGHSKYQHRE